MKVTTKNNTLIIEIEMADPPTQSASGKTLVVASTRGNVQTSLLIKGKPLTVGLNAYIPNK